ncbi:MAG: nucleotide sugar dehydrogenase [Chloroflexi bacterium]|nr:nucleotide sugar dehydrogenase [Chloroflexota bacterium]
MDLISKIQEHKSVIAVVGMGYVGLPLAVAFAESGFHVVGIDLDRRKVDMLNQGQSYIADVSSERIARLSRARRIPLNGTGTLTATSDYDAIEGVDAAIICVPTPLSKTNGPDLSYIISATDQIAGRLHPDMLVVLESTTYPGTTEEIVLPRLANSNGRKLQAGQDFYLAFSPERIDPGRKDWTVQNTPKVIGGIESNSLEVAVKLYGSAIQHVVPVSSTRAAEAVKLLENTFRATNIGLVNEIAIMCSRLGIDVWEVIEAAKSKPFGYMPFYPGPGLGGHCIPVDPQYLAWKMRTLNYTARFIQVAEEVNFGMPAYVVSRIVDALNDDTKSLKGSKVLVLGVAYKADVDDVRESPAIEIIDLLEKKGAHVTYNDPHVPSLDVDGRKHYSTPLDPEALRSNDCTVITTAHNAYDWQAVVDNSTLVVDTRNAAASAKPGKGRVVKL